MGSVERLADRARSITVARLNERLPVEEPDDELGRLATVFNETLERLDASFGQMRRFTGDVSHELRTPLAAIRTVGEVGLRERRSPDAYRAVIESMLEEADRLSSLVERLLLLSRAEGGQTPLKPERLDSALNWSTKSSRNSASWPRRSGSASSSTTRRARRPPPTG